MALTRRMLKELGLEEESIEKIMTEHGKVMEGMTTKAQAEEERKKALEDFEKDYAEKHKPTPVVDSKEYKELEQKYKDLEFDVNMRNAKVKDKYREFVKSKLATDKPFEEAIKEIQAEYAEFFESEEKQPVNPPSNKPTVGGNEAPKGGEITEEEKLKAAFLSGFKR